MIPSSEERESFKYLFGGHSSSVVTFKEYVNSLEEQYVNKSLYEAQDQKNPSYYLGALGAIRELKKQIFIE